MPKPSGPHGFAVSLVPWLSRFIVRYSSTKLVGSVQEVCTTGYSFMTPSGRVSKYGVFWGLDDPRNTIREIPGVTHVAAMLMAMIDAVSIARETVDGKKLLLYTDYNFSGSFRSNLRIYAARDFYSYRDGLRMKNAELLKELHSLTSDMDEELLFQLFFLEVGEEMDNDGNIASTSSNDWPLVYTTAICKAAENGTGFMSASYATVWPDKRCGTSTMHRLAMVPVTLFRAQLCAIEEALRQAVDNRLSRVVIVTDSHGFMSNWRKQWKKTNGSLVPNKFLYNRIKDLVESGIQVRFRYETPKDDNSSWSEAIDKCVESIRLPLVGKDRSEYKREISEILEKSPLDSTTTKVRVFKKGVKSSGWVVWGTTRNEIEDVNQIQGRIHYGLIDVLEKASSMGMKHIIIRTDSVRLILAAENWLPVWHRNGWRNSLHKPIADADFWKKIWWLKRTVKVYWELMDPLDDNDIGIAEKISSMDVIEDVVFTSMLSSFNNLEVTKAHQIIIIASDELDQTNPSLTIWSLF
ncbi:hypothetical protein DICVIV_07404 [Dictyocaulus viviparus]|uniref:RNase H type-1 domain-containing protein n=1 Tax=Dictyocaulus viviparus TaxID=29172 RepID=A0A0D8XVZ8_DICVI|nr:hypothetical protein DICVIV_07404 [Dictyocaulus viviparus]